ncbi:MAG: RdgB/HAM1 family non-canonical purine NTP pyrophosphatase [Burkholderiales bacterium]|nr:RdgB/HAM1 family non-canonical purine NTP pyrophosphatase [Anaerolineae bacterium]
MKTLEVLIGTHNQGKVREFGELLADAAVRCLSMNDVNLTVKVDETADTFEGNAVLKAVAYAGASGMLTLADDSGLMVDALDGAPGLYSARYGDPGLDDAGRRFKLLNALKDVPEEARTARFIAVIALARPQEGVIATVEGTVEGCIAFADQDGPVGFGYDAIFIPDGFAPRSFAELSKGEKNRISHRGVAATKLIPILRELAEKS